LYGSLLRINHSAVVALNLAIATANTGQLLQGYQQLVALHHELEKYKPY
jgi:predicted RNA polymerase sigma factor